jgi:CRISPR-associated protein Cmr2
MNETLWQTKLAARIHDPAEKALVLLRDPAGHEGGTSRALVRLLGYGELSSGTVDPDNEQSLAATLFKKGIPAAMYRHVQRADWWAAAADRPQWPMREITVTTGTGDQKTFAVAPWAQVRWAKEPVLIHPLTGDMLDLKSLTDTEIGEAKRRSFEHFSKLLVDLGAQDEASIDWRKALLAFWRFGPELEVTGADTADNQRLGQLWSLLPADTRVPEHSIWDHLDLTSAFAGAFAADPDGDAALLALSIGPVQPFIAAARKTEDLWAGSHLLSRLAWEAIKSLAVALGPDAILFPRLRGVAQVDLWLRGEMALPVEWFAQTEWRNAPASDANPLFAAALPNRFVAVVPAARAKELAEACRDAVRGWLLERGLEVVDRLLETAKLKDEAAPRDENAPAYAQMRAQLDGFPEVHWAAVPFSLIRCRDEAKQRDLECSNLFGAMAPFFGVEAGKRCGFLDSAAWSVLAGELELAEDGRKDVFFAPNPGVLYPAVFDLAERVLAASKAARPFEQARQEGWRESLTGEVEWLTIDRTHLSVPAGKRRSRKGEGFDEREHVETLWTRVADEQPSFAKKGEHLGALSAIKRLWPTLFAEEVAAALDRPDIGRFVVSTHTMALARQIEQWLERGGLTAPSLLDAAALLGQRLDRDALPRRLVRRYGRMQPEALADARRLPALLDAAGDLDDERKAERVRRAVRDTLANAIEDDAACRRFRLETYYAIVMMDGDRMGMILSGDEMAKCQIPYRDSFHPRVRAGFDERARQHAAIEVYGRRPRAVSPGRHLAISAALNDFSQQVVRHVVEIEHPGRVIYAGGDDVLAMLPVADLLACMQRLRHAYGGTLPEDETRDWGDLRRDREKLRCKNGFAFLDGRLMRMMGRQATASAGAVVAHHQAPLSAMLRELRAAEGRAKTEGGRDAFSITVIKRSGGALRLTAKWGEPLALLNDLIMYLRDEDTSRRAVYHSLEWLADLPEPEGDGAMLEHLLSYQLARQSKDRRQKDRAPDLARRLTALAVRQPQNQRKDWLRNFLTVAEFLAREVRAGGEGTQPDTGRDTAPVAA